jgi:metallophosphoesterase superfamily enzyme
MGEVAGHLHPVVTVQTRVKRMRRKCFVSDGVRCILPSAGAFTGGLDVTDDAFAPLFDSGLQCLCAGQGEGLSVPLGFNWRPAGTAWAAWTVLPQGFD